MAMSLVLLSCKFRTRKVTVYVRRVSGDLEDSDSMRDSLSKQSKGLKVKKKL